MSMYLKVSQWKQVLLDNTDWLCKELKPLYGVKSLTQIDVKSWNAIFRADTESGCICVKILNECTTGIRRHYNDLMYVASVTRAFAQYSGYVVPSPIAGNDGMEIRRVGNYWCIVYPWLDMTNMQCLQENTAQNISISRKAAQLLATLHGYGAQLSSVVGNRPITELYSAYPAIVWSNNIDKIWSKGEECMRHRGLSKTGKEILKNAKKEVASFISTSNKYFDYTEQNSIVLHGDYRPENIALSNRQSAIWDFDCTNSDAPETELAYAALSFAGPRFFNGPRQCNIVSEFIRTYKHEKVISVSEDVIRDALLWQALRMLSLSFDEEQLCTRFGTYRNLQEILQHIEL